MLTGSQGAHTAPTLLCRLTGATGTGFGADDGASLLMTFRGLQSESAAQGQTHKNIAKELETLVVDPFDDWAKGYKVPLPYTAQDIH